ncbi:MAG: N-acetylmuramoyl-L-alanine amidase, partial [Muribaculaceae bacterium]|nr:N-acetylmuramoyl-L-alanine amidase [Muribaculaceae bacterium]
FVLRQSRHMEQRIAIAEVVQQSLVSNANRVDKGVKQAGFWVLWATSMPSILIELDFICNPVQEKFLASEQGQKKLADAIYEGFITYKEFNPVDN